MTTPTLPAIVHPVELPLDDLVPSEENPRRNIADGTLAGLVASITANGIIQPLVVRPLPGDERRYEIIAGHRRYAAARKAGLAVVPVRIVTMTDDRQVQTMRIVENLQRSNLDPVEEASALESIRTQYSMTDEAVGALIGKSGAWVNRSRKVLELPRTVQDALRARVLNPAQGWALQRYRAFPALAERLALIAQRDGIGSKTLDVPFVQAKELATLGLIVSLDHLPPRFDLEQCYACPFKAYFPDPAGGQGWCARLAHYRLLVHEARRQEIASGEIAPSPPPAYETRRRGPTPKPLTPTRLRARLARQLQAVDHLVEQLRPADAGDADLRVVVLQHVGVLDRVIGIASLVAHQEEE